MKKVLLLVFVCFLVFSCFSCGNKRNTCVVTFNYNHDIAFLDGLPSKGPQHNRTEKSTQTVIKGEYISSAPTPSSIGTLSALSDSYIFGGWYKEPACENVFDFNSEPINTDINLYAKWIKIEPDVSW